MSDLKQYALEIHKPAIKKFARRKVNVFFVNELWCADLLDVSNISQDNYNIKFLLNIIDVYSRYVFCFPLKSKKSSEIVNAFKSLKELPHNLWVDEGSEFYNKDFKKFCSQNDINMYHTYSGIKSSFVERFNRTIRQMMYIYFTEHNTDYYLDVLDKMIKSYNNKIHSSIKQKPVDVYNYKTLPYTKYIPTKDDIPIKPKFKVNDYVRISKVKQTFEKGYTARWSKEVFKIVSIDDSQYPYMYKLEDLNGEDVKGKFYEEELQKTDLKDFSVIEKIIRKKKVNGKYEYLVKWDGYPEKFNSWITEEKLERIK